VNIIASPLNQSDVDKESTFITIGSPGYNWASERVENHFHALAKFVNNNSGLQLANTPVVSVNGCAFVQRAVDQTTGQVAFYVAGPSTQGTTGAARYLASEWKQLDRRYPLQRPFCIMLRISSQDGRHHEVLFER